MSNISLASLNLAALVALHNGAIIEYGAPEGFAEVSRFASKAKGVEAIEALCAAGNLAVQFDGDNAVIVDATEAPDAGGDDESEAPALETGGADGGGKARAWGFATASDAWLEAHPRGTPEREAYRKNRRKAARMARKAERTAKESAREAASA